LNQAKLTLPHSLPTLGKIFEDQSHTLLKLLVAFSRWVLKNLLKIRPNQQNKNPYPCKWNYILEIGKKVLNVFYLKEKLKKALKVQPNVPNTIQTSKNVFLLCTGLKPNLILFHQTVHAYCIVCFFDPETDRNWVQRVLFRVQN
jgi:hypothetical protein